MMWKQAAVAFARTQVLRRKTVPQTHIQTRTQAASLHLRNVTGLLLHSKPTGALNKHLFLPVNPPCLHHAAYTALPRHTNTPLSSLRSPLLLTSLALLFLWHYPPESHLYTDIWNTNKETRTRRGGEDYSGLRFWQSFRSLARDHNASTHSLHCTQWQLLKVFMNPWSDFVQV